MGTMSLLLLALPTLTSPLTSGVFKPGYRGGVGVRVGVGVSVVNRTFPSPDCGLAGENLSSTLLMPLVLCGVAPGIRMGVPLPPTVRDGDDRARGGVPLIGSMVLRPERFDALLSSRMDVSVITEDFSVMLSSLRWLPLASRLECGRCCSCACCCRLVMRLAACVALSNAALACSNRF